MNENGKILVCGMLALFLFGTEASAFASSQVIKSGHTQIAFQEERQPVENSIIRPSVRRNSTPDQIYRHDNARNALKSGRILSLSIIRSKIQQSFPGKIVDVRLLEPKRDNRPYLYQVKVLRSDGKLLEVTLNATTAEIIKVKGNS